MQQIIENCHSLFLKYIHLLIQLLFTYLFKSNISESKRNVDKVRAHL